MIKILFLIHDLGQGGAEKVLVNLVNNMDRSKFDISVTTLFGGGVNEQFLAPDITYRAVFPKEFPGNSQVMKLLTPEQLHKLCVKEEYDIEVSYLEGPSARVISGCKNPGTTLLSWIHCMHASEKHISYSFRGLQEAKKCYSRFNTVVCVSQNIKNNFVTLLGENVNTAVLYNTIESDKIILQSSEVADEIDDKDEVKLVAVGTLKEVKGFDRLLKIVKRLIDEQYSIKLYLLGEGPLRGKIEQFIQSNNLEDKVSLLGYQSNPYKYVSKCDLFICSSYSEGFSTAVTEALIVGTPVCTVEVSGMKEMLGDNNEYGIVTDNDEDALYAGIKRFLDEPELLEEYRQKALLRGKMFNTESTVKAVENMLLEL